MSKFPIPLADPLELLVLFDDDIISGKVKLYDWQKDKLRALGKVRTNGELIREALVSANGTGKSQFIISPFAVWMACNFDESLTVITTSSGDQLNKQDDRYIHRLCANVNRITGVEFFKTNFRHYQNLITNSFIDLFATDEPGKAEGSHPLCSGGEFAIIVDEAKSVEESIFNALSRCNGCTRRLDVSSPGDCVGTFFDECTHPESPFKGHTSKVTAYDCSHIPKQEIQWLIDKHGINDPLVRSSIFAEFTSVGESIVITNEMLNKNKQYFNKAVHFGRKRAGLDLAAGGDENVLSVWWGNEQIAQETGTYRNTVIGAEMIMEWIKKHDLKPEDIYADDGGVGRGIIDQLWAKGFKVKRILNQWSPVDRTRYANRGTELWFNLRRFVEEYQVQFLNDKILRDQLAHRYFKRRNNDILLLEPKAEAKAKGHPSPDRADAAVLAWSPIVFPSKELEIQSDPPPIGISKDELVKAIRDLAYNHGTDNAAIGSNIKDGKYVKINFCNFNQRKIIEEMRKWSR